MIGATFNQLVEHLAHALGDSELRRDHACVVDEAAELEHRPGELRLVLEHGGGLDTERVRVVEFVIFGVS